MVKPKGRLAPAGGTKRHLLIRRYQVPLHSTPKVRRDRDRLERIERGAHHRQLCSNADFFAMPDLELELDRTRADAADHQAEAQDVADLARAGEVAFHPDYRGADALFCDLIDKADSETACEPVLD